MTESFGREIHVYSKTQVWVENGMTLSRMATMEFPVGSVEEIKRQCSLMMEQDPTIENIEILKPVYKITKQ